MTKTLVVLLITFGCYALYEITKFSVLINRGKKVVDTAQKFEQSPDAPVHSLLVIGDSTGYGTGADTPEESVAGRIGADHPNWRILNRSINGLKVNGLRNELEQLDPNVHFNTILINIGGNDVLRFTSTDSVANDINAALSTARTHSDNVILMPSGNVGAAPAFSPLLSFIYEKRTRLIRDTLMNAADHNDVTYVDLFVEPENDPFIHDPWKYHAADGLHPSSDGYALWYKALKPKLK